MRISRSFIIHDVPILGSVAVWPDRDYPVEVDGQGYTLDSLRQAREALDLAVKELEAATPEKRENRGASYVYMPEVGDIVTVRTDYPVGVIATDVENDKWRWNGEGWCLPTAASRWPDHGGTRFESISQRYLPLIITELPEAQS